MAGPPPGPRGHPRWPGCTPPASSAAMIQHAGADPARVVLAPFGPDQVRPALAPAQPAAVTSPLVPQAEGDRSSLRLLRRVGRLDPGSLDANRAAGGYEMLRRAVV